MINLFQIYIYIYIYMKMFFIWKNYFSMNEQRNVSLHVEIHDIRYIKIYNTQSANDETITIYWLPKTVLHIQTSAYFWTNI